MFQLYDRVKGYLVSEPSGHFTHGADQKNAVRGRFGLFAILNSDRLRRSAWIDFSGTFYLYEIIGMD